MQLGLALLHALKTHGAREIFGIPGDFILPLFRHIEASNVLPLYALSHEPSLGFAADGAARAGGGLGAIAVTYGAGALNVVNAVAGAYAERSPLVVIAGSPGFEESKAGLVLHHQVRSVESQYRIFQEITCDQVKLIDAAGAPGAIARVLRSCRELSQPVLIELPRDMADVDVATVPTLPPSPFDADEVDACAEAWLQRLAQAERPVLMVDVEVRRYQLEARVAALAQALGVPVVTTFMGRGLLAETGLAVHGTYLGVAGSDDVTRLVEEADLHLMLGTILSDSNFGIGRQRFDFRHALIAARREVRIRHRVYRNIPLDAFVDALLARVSSAVARSAPTRPSPPSTDFVADSRPIAAADLSAALNQRILRTGGFPVVADVGDALFCAMELSPTPMIAPGYYASMGFAVPAALGVQARTGERPLVLVGDGAFQMTGWELGHCRRHGWDPVVLVLNNQSWEMIRAFEPSSRCADLGDWHYAELAAGLGGDGQRVRTRGELDAALARAFACRGRFQLIEVMLAPGDCTPTLRRFADGLRARRAAIDATPA